MRVQRALTTIYLTADHCSCCSSNRDSHPTAFVPGQSRAQSCSKQSTNHTPLAAVVVVDIDFLGFLRRGLSRAARAGNLYLFSPIPYVSRPVFCTRYVFLPVLVPKTLRTTRITRLGNGLGFCAYNANERRSRCANQQGHKERLERGHRDCSSTEKLLP